MGGEGQRDGAGDRGTREGVGWGVKVKVVKTVHESFLSLTCPGFLFIFLFVT